MPTIPIDVTVLEVRPTQAGRLVALASVELVVDGFAIALHGIQVVRQRDPATGREATGVDLPRYRGQDGAWRPAVTLPEELRRPVGRAVLERCVELGIAVYAADGT